MSVLDAGRQWASALTGRPEMRALASYERRAAELATGIAEEDQLRPLTRQDLDDLVERVVDAAVLELGKRRRQG